VSEGDADVATTGGHGAEQVEQLEVLLGEERVASPARVGTDPEAQGQRAAQRQAASCVADRDDVGTTWRLVWVGESYRDYAYPR
jgi:hypothetical protein